MKKELRRVLIFQQKYYGQYVILQSVLICTNQMVTKEPELQKYQ